MRATKCVTDAHELPRAGRSWADEAGDGRVVGHWNEAYRQAGVEAVAGAGAGVGVSVWEELCNVDERRRWVGDGVSEGRVGR